MSGYAAGAVVRVNCLKAFMEMAATTDAPFCRCVLASTEAGVVVPSILSSQLSMAGFSVTYHEGPGEDARAGNSKLGAWVQVRTKAGVLAARGYSSDQVDALFQAVYAEVQREYRENRSVSRATAGASR